MRTISRTLKILNTKISMKNNTLLYDLGSEVVAFTTKRCLGRNREGICHLLGIADGNLIYPHQTHQDKVLVIDAAFMALGANERKEVLEGVDAVVTQLNGVCVGVSTADCIPVILYDEKQKVAAAAHAGWRGTVARIAQKTLRIMQSECGTEAQNVRAVIGPGISMKSFEIGDEVYDEFVRNGFEMDTIAKRYPDTKNAGAEKWHIDLPLCNKQQLMALGVPSENVEIVPIDTYTNTDKFFSARIEQKGPEKCGRNFNAIMIL